MILAEEHYAKQAASQIIADVFHRIIDDFDKLPIIICIGSDRHILDCLGPMVGTMLVEKQTNLKVYGTLDYPIHAKNINQEMRIIKQNHIDMSVIAVDASIGNQDELGLIRVKDEAIIPGKAMARRLLPIGDYSVTGIVGCYSRNPAALNQGSIAHVYKMANIISNAIVTGIGNQC